MELIDNIDRIAVGIDEHIQYLLTEGNISLCGNNLRIIEYGSSANTLANDPCLDRFKIAIPYAGKTLLWEILFNQEKSFLPPDFIFGADDIEFMPDIENLKSLINWDVDCKSCLSQVLKELLSEYLNYQISCVDINSRLAFECTSLFESNQYDSSSIEVYVTKKNNFVFGPVSFLIKLDVDFSKIPSYLTKDDPGEDTALLLVTFPSPDSVKVTPQLFLSPRIERALGGSSNMRIPGFPSGACLIDYVPDVTELLSNKVENIVSSYEKRRDYVSTFLSTFGRSVIEFDAEAFMHIHFLFEWRNFFFLIKIDLSQSFPKEAPIFTFQSIYHQSGDEKPFMMIEKNYPYSPRWTPLEMADRARAFIMEKVRDFQKASVFDGTS